MKNAQQRTSAQRGSETEKEDVGEWPRRGRRPEKWEGGRSTSLCFMKTCTFCVSLCTRGGAMGLTPPQCTGEPVPYPSRLKCQ